ncbi:hypothetical protein KEM60_00197 [Austwickia sp. TVS 96-490-7B]|uniref:hypothetical protein n=1 Tax=Austwickia sp. TVS 96-490-7B TaxID=2830843 RepID=UPI001C562721|nr:hypothetical protein [Austwickia sp. TVS 96-490-7B]MBW3084014.1 hypothetical protein [Austwickia sp. TVS 96-490-7B]
MNTQLAVAPAAPGSLGEDIAPAALLEYLTSLGEWRDRRRAELDVLDEASLRSSEGDQLTADVMLSMTLWKAVSDRHDLLVATWDDGRVMEADRRRMSTLIWGRLDPGHDSSSALAVSLPEACRLSDSLASSLRGRLRMDGSEPDVDARVREVRATIARIHDQIALVPSAARDNVVGVHDRLEERARDITERSRRGADVGGLLPSLELDAAQAERDLIVGAARRAQAKADAQRARQRRDELDACSRAVEQLATRCVQDVWPAPRFAVPNPDVLGDPPTDPTALTVYLERIDMVSQALAQCHSAYAGALEHRDELLGAADAYAAKGAELTDPAHQEDLSSLVALIESTRATRPIHVGRLGALVAALQAYVTAASQVGPRKEPRP